MKIGALPRQLTVDGVKYDIDPSWINVLEIFTAINDPDLADGFTEAETKAQISFIILTHLYGHYTDGKWEAVVPENVAEALQQAVWFMDGGDKPKVERAEQKLFDWEFDQHIIFPAINKSAGFEVREKPDMHWWTFLSYMGVIPSETMYSQVLNIRRKKQKHKKLEKWEEDFYRENMDIIDLPHTHSNLKSELDEETDLIRGILGIK